MEIAIQARLRYSSLFNPSDQVGEGGGKYNALMLMTPGSKSHKTIEEAIKKVAQEKWADKAPGVLKALKADNRICLSDGERKADKDGFEGMVFISTSNAARPTVVDRDKTPLTQADGRPYNGCYVNAIVDIWPQDNQYGKRINAKLLGVQFYKDGEPFASGKAAASVDQFEDLGEDEDDEVTL